MHPFPAPPRQVQIGDAAAFVGITPRSIRHYHQIGLLPERERGADGRRRYGYGEIIRLLWIRRMADAGIALDDIRDAFDGGAPGGAASGGVASGGGAPGGPASDGAAEGIADVLARLEDALAAQEADLVVVPDRPGGDADERGGVADLDLAGWGRERVHGGPLGVKGGCAPEQTT